MKAISAVQKGQTPDGKRIMDVFILADSAPGTLPTTGADVTGMMPDDLFAPFSILYALPDSIYIANESGTFAAI